MWVFQYFESKFVSGCVRICVWVGVCTHLPSSFTPFNVVRLQKIRLDWLRSWDWIQTYIVFILLQVPDYDVRETVIKNAKVNGPTFLGTNI